MYCLVIRYIQASILHGFQNQTKGFWKICISPFHRTMCGKITRKQYIDLNAFVFQRQIAALPENNGNSDHAMEQRQIICQTYYCHAQCNVIHRCYTQFAFRVTNRFSLYMTKYFLGGIVCKIISDITVIAYEQIKFNCSQFQFEFFSMIIVQCEFLLSTL